MMANLYTLNRWIILGLSQNLWDYHKDGCDYQVHCHTVVPVQFIEAFNFEHNIQFIFLHHPGGINLPNTVYISAIWD